MLHAGTLRKCNHGWNSAPRFRKRSSLSGLKCTLARNHHVSSPLSLQRTLLYSRLPPDLGLWSLEQALDRADAEPALAVKLLRLAYRTLDDPSLSEGLTLGRIRRSVRGHGDLAREFEKLDLPRTAEGSDKEDKWRREMDELAKERRAKRRQNRAEWTQLLSEHEREVVGQHLLACEPGHSRKGVLRGHQR